MKNRKRLLVLIGVLLLCLGAATDQLAVSIFKTPKPHLFDVSTSRVGDGYVIKMGKSEVRAWLKDSKIVFTSRGLSEQVQKSLAKFADNHLTHTTPQRALDIFVEKDVPFQLLATAPIERDLALSDPE